MISAAQPFVRYDSIMPYLSMTFKKSSLLTAGLVIANILTSIGLDLFILR